MGERGLLILEITRDSTEDVEASLFENFLAIAQTVKDGGKCEIIIHYPPPSPKRKEKADAEPRLPLR